jgi:hypothetical protein
MEKSENLNQGYNSCVAVIRLPSLQQGLIRAAAPPTPHTSTSAHWLWAHSVVTLFLSASFTFAAHVAALLPMLCRIA